MAHSTCTSPTQLGTLENSETISFSSDEEVSSGDESLSNEDDTSLHVANIISTNMREQASRSISPYFDSTSESGNPASPSFEPLSSRECLVQQDKWRTYSLIACYREFYVPFPTPFKSTPRVAVGVGELKVKQLLPGYDSTMVTVDAIKVGPAGFTIAIIPGYNTLIEWCPVSWIAMGDERDVHSVRNQGPTVELTSGEASRYALDNSPPLTAWSGELEDDIRGVSRRGMDCRISPRKRKRSESTGGRKVMIRARL